MRSLKRAMLVAAVLGSISSTGAGMAQANGSGAPDVTLNNAQTQDCNYNALIPVQIPIAIGILGHGASTAIGQTCQSTGPSFGK